MQSGLVRYSSSVSEGSSTLPSPGSHSTASDSTPRPYSGLQRLQSPAFKHLSLTKPLSFSRHNVISSPITPVVYNPFDPDVMLPSIESDGYSDQDETDGDRNETVERMPAYPCVDELRLESEVAALTLGTGLPINNKLNYSEDSSSDSNQSYFAGGARANVKNHNLEYEFKKYHTTEYSKSLERNGLPTAPPPPNEIIPHYMASYSNYSPSSTNMKSESKSRRTEKRYEKKMAVQKSMNPRYSGFALGRKSKPGVKDIEAQKITILEEKQKANCLSLSSLCLMLCCILMLIGVMVLIMFMFPEIFLHKRSSGTLNGGDVFFPGHGVQTTNHP